MPFNEMWESLVSLISAIWEQKNICLIWKICSICGRFHYSICGGLSILNEIPYGKGSVCAHSFAIERNSLREILQWKIYLYKTV